MSRHTKRQYEDVALVLSEKRIYFSHLCNDAQAIVAEQVADRIAHSLADLFAADNPPTCRWGSRHHVGPCDLGGGFDREQFLAACGLETGQ